MSTPAATPTLGWQPLPSHALPAPNFNYSPVVQAGPFIFVSGLVGLDKYSGRLAPGGLGAQTTQIFSNFSALCREFGWGLEQLLLVRIYCADFSQFAELNRRWDEFFAGTTAPARTSLGVSALPLNALVEMEFQLVVSPSTNQ